MILNADYTPDQLVIADDGNTITGVAVPYEVFGRTSAGPVAFAPGSLPTGPVDVPLCLDHDTTRPIGVVHAADSNDEALVFTAALDDTPEAANARTQMRSRSRRGISVGVDVTAYEDTPDGMRVLAADWLELSSVVIPAFREATVAAAAKKKTDPPKEEEPVSEPTQTVTEVVPEHTPRNVSVATPRTLAQFAAHLARAVRTGDAQDSRDVTRLILSAEQAAVRAALADITTAETPPQGTWVSQMDNLVMFGMPTVDAFTTVPTDRWPVKQRQIKTWPTAGKQTAEKAEIASTVVETEWVNISDDTYAHGNDVSLQDIEDNGEQILTEIFEITSEVVGNLINGDALTAIAAAASNGGTGATVFDDLDALGGALGTVLGSGRGSPVVVCAPDVWGKLWSLTATGGPAISRLTGVDTPLPVIPDKQVTPGTAYVGARGAFKTYMSSLSRLRAIEVSLLGLNIGTYRRAAFRVVDSAALVKLALA